MHGSQPCDMPTKRLYGPFVENFVKRANALRVGNGLDPQTEMGPLASQSQLGKNGNVRANRQTGGRIDDVWRKPPDQGHLAAGYFYAPTIFSEVDRNMRIAREEIFGPVVSVLRVKNLEEAIEISNDPVYGLSSSIYTRNGESCLFARCGT